MDDKEKEQFQKEIDDNKANQVDPNVRIGGDKFEKGRSGIVIKRGGKSYRIDRLPNKK